MHRKVANSLVDNSPIHIYTAYMYVRVYLSAYALSLHVLSFSSFAFMLQITVPRIALVENRDCERVQSRNILFCASE